MGSIELVCPAGSPPMLRAAVEAGADSVYCGLRDETNARNFPGLNFSPAEMKDAVAFARARGAKVLVAINTFARAGADEAWRRSVDTAVAAGAHAVIVADIGVLSYAREAYPDLRLHLSVQAAANSAEAIAFYAESFGVRRVVLPRVMSAPEIAALVKATSVELEAFVFGGLCVMAEGRCALSSYATGRSPNLSGVCSPPEAVSFETDTNGLTPRLAGVAIDRFRADEAAGYPTLCKGRFAAMGETSYLFEDPVSLNAMTVLRDLRAAGVTAIKVEGRQRGKTYVRRVTEAFRGAIDALDAGRDCESFARMLTDLAEGGRETEGAYKRKWR
ncbi:MULTISPECIES: peptidase U32 family protein [unclassified Caulobacter]|jgi:putative protease|uniref:Ubiquinone biosynthesis protein UbiU n=1 Tax=Caulobacter vibrioides TaxID=155892 RepID=A0A258DAS1_CAUVI|nr:MULTISPECIES: peptidase U32 family protein [unclassified Caulobacter]AZS19858.1 U32 family peptidase [Caulobacter sp. FWC26]OYX04911.1 MAG: protease [Caulobacter vibrioides]